jgi:hypothetical protein
MSMTRPSRLRRPAVAPRRERPVRAWAAVLRRRREGRRGGSGHGQALSTMRPPWARRRSADGRGADRRQHGAADGRAKGGDGWRSVWCRRQTSGRQHDHARRAMRHARGDALPLTSRVDMRSPIRVSYPWGERRRTPARPLAGSSTSASRSGLAASKLSAAHENSTALCVTGHRPA